MDVRFVKKRALSDDKEAWCKAVIQSEHGVLHQPLCHIEDKIANYALPGTDFLR